jgi:hypothetical protein
MAAPLAESSSAFGAKIPKLQAFARGQQPPLRFLRAGRRAFFAADENSGRR